jgi:hypothetical protein
MLRALAPDRGRCPTSRPRPQRQRADEPARLLRIRIHRPAGLSLVDRSNAASCSLDRTSAMVAVSDSAAPPRLLQIAIARPGRRLPPGRGDGSSAVAYVQILRGGRPTRRPRWLRASGRAAPGGPRTQLHLCGPVSPGRWRGSRARSAGRVAEICWVNLPQKHQGPCFVDAGGGSWRVGGRRGVPRSSVRRACSGGEARISSGPPRRLEHGDRPVLGGSQRAAPRPPRPSARQPPAMRVGEREAALVLQRRIRVPTVAVSCGRSLDDLPEVRADRSMAKRPASARSSSRQASTASRRIG